jgi:hypothetical protein
MFEAGPCPDNTDAFFLVKRNFCLTGRKECLLSETQARENDMTYFVTAYSNNKARLIEKTMRTNCQTTAETVADSWRGMGFIVGEHSEG